MKNISAVLCLLGFLFLCANLSSAEKMFDFKGQISGWSSIGDNGQFGLRYIPEVDLVYPLSSEKKLDSEISANLYSYAPYKSAEDFGDNATAKLYRTWVRYSTSQIEARLGLQRINFGPAKYFRSLIWFDNLDPRDPLKLTNGVWGLLGHYYFTNNANIWLWGLYGNKDVMGWEIVETDKDKVEFGGRCQIPVPRGEIAFSFDNRYLDKKDWEDKIPTSLSSGIQNRYAVDGSFDIGIGAWFEFVAAEIKIDSENSVWDKFLTVGIDYTFDIGPGIHIVYEHFFKSPEPETREWDPSYRLSALSIDFNISALDSVTAIIYYNWENEGVHPYLAWQRTYNDWLINISVFSDPESGPALYSGTGALCIVAYNY